MGLFQICSSDTSTSQILVDCQSFEVAKISLESLTETVGWLEALAIACLVRDARTASQHGAVDLHIPNGKISGFEREAHLRTMTEAFAAYELKAPHGLETSRQARALPRPDALAFQPPVMVERLHGATLDILLALLTDDAEGFASAVRTAVAGQAAYVVEDERTHQHEMLHQWLFLGFAAKGHERGWLVEIYSGYFPTWMVADESGGP